MAEFKPKPIEADEYELEGSETARGAPVGELEARVAELEIAVDQLRAALGVVDTETRRASRRRRRRLFLLASALLGWPPIS